ncbi:MAG: alpha/beta hydrolase [Ferruginibacter sp.]|nr:alpha/beta hydrolase [Cytophagales bacterium]
MPSLQSYWLKYQVRRREEKTRDLGLTLENKRKQFEDLATRVKPPAGMFLVSVMANGVPCEWVKTAKGTDAHTIFFLHGGSYTRGSIPSHRSLAARLAEASGGRALVVGYRLAPEAPYPAALDDAMRAYAWLLKRVPRQKILFAGDSAGGGLALAVMLKLRDEKTPLPAAAVLLCPWVDLECTGASYTALFGQDPVLRKEELLESAGLYLQQGNPRDPLVSPLCGNLKGLPPLFIQLGTLDSLLDEGQQLAAKAREAGVKVELDVWEDMIHVWHLFGDRLPEAGKAIRKAGAFISQQAGV